MSERTFTVTLTLPSLPDTEPVLRIVAVLSESRLKAILWAIIDAHEDEPK